MHTLLKLAAAGFGALVAFSLTSWYHWALDTPEGVAFLTFVGTLAGLCALRDDKRSQRRFERGVQYSYLTPSSLTRRPDIVLRIRRALFAVCAWTLLVIGAAIAYENRSALKTGAIHLISALQPGRAITVAPGEALLTQSMGGHFTAIAMIEGASFSMLVDTGSTDVALPYEDALRIGIDPDSLRFEHEVITANGPAHVAMVTLPSIEVGPIVMKDVRASIAQPGRLSGALLGMSFLGRLSEVSFSGKQLRLRE